MIKKIVIITSIPLLLSASIFDFMSLNSAEKSYAEGNYTEAINEYSSIENKSDELLYDEANSYYKLKQYEKARELYSAISSKDLLFKKWHNLGNTYAQLGKLDEGIKAYEEALKIKEDKDTRFNLELLKKKKKEQEKKKRDDKKKDNKKNDKKDNKKDDKKKDSDKNQKDEDKKSDKKSDKDKKEKDKEKEKKDSKKNDEKRDKENDKKKNDKKNKSNKDKGKAPMKKEPISDKELRKYQKMLDQRGINTLLVPLDTKGDNNNELKPW